MRFVFRETDSGLVEAQCADYDGPFGPTVTANCKEDAGVLLGICISAKPQLFERPFWLMKQWEEEVSEWVEENFPKNPRLFQLKRIK
jgi:hypothetical protein